jgi:gliding motility-associated-like protein
LSATNIPNPIATPLGYTNYYLTLTDQYNCRNIDSTEIFVYQKPNFAITNKPKFICFDIPYLISAYSESNLTYVWSPNKFINDTSLMTPTIIPKDTGYYYVTATSIWGCKKTDSILLRVQKPIQAQVVSPIKICQGNNGILSASGGMYYDWSPRFKLYEPYKPNPTTDINYNFTYYVRVSNDCFYKDTSVLVMIDTLQKIKAESDQTIYRGQTAQLNVKNAIGKVEWFPKTAINDPYSLHPSVNPLYTTAYRVVLKDDRGCTAEDTVTVKVEGKTVVLVPNAFSPNGDNLNDVFGIIKHLNIEKLNYFGVYNRWGEVIFITENINGKWDGKGIKTDDPSAVYTWVVSAVTYDGETVLYKGNVTLLR